MKGNPIFGISLVASTSPWVAQCPVWVSTSLAMTLPGPVRLAADSPAERHPAELPQGDDQAADTPGSHYEQVSTGEAGPCRVRVVGGQQRGGEVADGEHVGDIYQPLRQHRGGHEHAGDEVQGQHDRLGKGLSRVLVADQPLTQAVMLPLYFISGVFVAASVLPQWLIDVADVFPVRHLAAALLTAYNPNTTGAGFAGTDLLIVAAWGV